VKAFLTEFLMSKITKSNVQSSNRLLAALPLGEYRRMFSKMEQIPLIYGKNIYELGEMIRSVYFPGSGIISLLSAVETNATLELGLIGNEGMVGLPLFLGVEASDNRAVVQGAGSALKMKAEDFLTECRSGGALPRLLQLFTHSLFTQISQSAVCNRFHSVDARLARWLLMTSDRMERDEFQITQEFLSNMLGVRREAVNKSAVKLQHQKIINYSRGHLSILDRTVLESLSCRCYRIIKQSYERA
jgi:CRP-like cAMP-binding protein